MLNALSRLFGKKDASAQIKPYMDKVAAINALEDEFAKLSDQELAGKTAEFRRKVEEGASADDLLVEAFANVREAGKRALGLRLFDVQLVGAMVLHEGKIAEMKTGEGKTLTATAAAYLNSLAKNTSVHIITVNEYLAARDAREMSPLFGALGLSVSCVSGRMGLNDEQIQTQGLLDAVKRQAYGCDVVYTIASEIGFDFMRDNMKQHKNLQAQQRGRPFAIVDEVDSVLIDEARLPLSISGAPEDVSHKFQAINKVIPHVSEDAYELDEKSRSLKLTEGGAVELEERLKAAGILPPDTTLYDPANATLLHNAQASLQAHKLFHKDKDYIVVNNDVVLINQLNGRPMPGRRMGGGVQQALEAKEGAVIRPESPTVASITFQNLFRTYDKLSGMTGTALTEENEFIEIYGLSVVEIPTNMPMVREDEEDLVYRKREEKIKAIVERIVEAHGRGQPVLVGTQTVEASEELSRLLKAQKVKHNVLNARHHDQEAVIIAEAGTPGAVTISTSMAGRGTDIQLGGNLSMRAAVELAGVEDEGERAKKLEAIKADIEAKKNQVVEAGGLMVIGTERGESRRVDNQLRGRSGRQGDPGSSVYFVSLEDDLMRIFGGQLDGILKIIGVKDDEAIYDKRITKTIAKAQEKIEQRNFDGRRQLIKYDDVMNDQRKSIYERRESFLNAEELKDLVEEWREEVLEETVYRFMPKGSNPGQWDLEALTRAIRNVSGLDIDAGAWAKEEGVDQEVVIERALEALDNHMAKRAVDIGADSMRQFEKAAVLQVLDQLWREQVQRMIQLREGIGLRAFGQRDPLTEYKREGFELFEDMLNRLRSSVTFLLARAQLQQVGPDGQPTGAKSGAGMPPRAAGANAAGQQPNLEQAAQAVEQLAAKAKESGTPVGAAQGATAASGGEAQGRDPNRPDTWGKVARNESCPCGSGKKYKQCHGA